MNIGERVKQLRKEKGMTQEELATKLGYKSKSSVTHIENGRDNLDRFHQNAENTLIIGGKHQPIISKEIYEAVQQRLAQRALSYN